MRLSLPMPARWAVLPLLCGLVATLATAAWAAGSGGDVVARYGNTDITAAMLDNFVRTLDPALRQKALSDSDVMDKLIRAEIARLAVLNEAKTKKWDQRPDVIAQIQRARDQAIVGSYVTSLTTPPSDYPSEQEIQSAYDLNRDSFMVPRQYLLQQIFIASPADADEKSAAAAKQKAEDVATKAKAPAAKFDDLARTYSEKKDTAARGGDLGWLPETELVPEIRNQVAGMDKGDVSDPIHVADGWQIIRLLDTKPPGPKPLAEVKDAIVTALRQRKAQENEQAYINDLLKKNPVEVNEIALRKVFGAAPR